MHKIVVYTAIFNNYDWLKDPFVVSKDIDYICFTDNENLKSKVWTIKVVDTQGKNPSIMNREIKLLYPYSVLSDYDYSLYVDGSIMIKGDIMDFLSPYLADRPLLMNFKHPNNNCIYKEMDKLIAKGWNRDVLERQYQTYVQQHMPKEFGLSDNKIILRDNHNEEGSEMMIEWFSEVVNYSGRDQTCLSYVLYKHNRIYDFFNENIENNQYFETWPHNNSPWYIILWRKFKWKCEKNNMGTGLINFLNNKVKPIVLKLYLKGT